MGAFYLGQENIASNWFTCRTFVTKPNRGQISSYRQALTLFTDCKGIDIDST